MAKHSTSVKPLRVLVCQLFKINYLHTSKTPFLRTVGLMLLVNSDFIIIVMNTDEKFFFI